MIFLWGPVAAWMGLIFYLSSIPNLNSGWGIWDTILRKGVHMFEYAVLTGLLIRAIRASWSNPTIRCVARWAALVAILYSISDEIHQGFVPGRGPSLLDVLIDSVGVVLCAVLWLRAGGHFRLKKL